jgi:LPXTG-site transpeptidase (sortase) family protein
MNHEKSKLRAPASSNRNFIPAVLAPHLRQEPQQEVRLYRVLKTAANVLIALGLLLMLYGLGSSARQTAADLSDVLEGTGGMGGVLAVLAPTQPPPPRTVPITAQELLPTTPPPDVIPVDMEAWEQFDLAIFDAEGEGFLPYQVMVTDQFAPDITPIDTPFQVFLPAVQGLPEPGEGEAAGTGDFSEAYPAPEPQPEQQPIIVVEVPAPTATPEPEPPRFPTRLVISRIDLDAPIIAVFPQAVTYAGQRFEQWQAPAQFAAGWHENSAWLGEKGNTVLNGHHNIYGMVFKRLHELAQDDEIVIYGDDQPYYYRINQVMILEERGTSIEQRAENSRWIMPSGDERLTLVTCWPPENNTHRLIVVATRQR